MLQYNPSISGSLNITGSLIISNGMIGTVNGVDVQIFSSSINQVITGIQAATSSQEGRLGSVELFTSSTSARLNSIESITTSNVARLNSIEIVSASNIARLSSLETTSASVDTTNTTQNTRLTNLESITGSLATTGSNTFFGTQVFSGSVYIANDLIVQGSSSIQYISASSVSIGTNIVQLNTATPSVRFAGLSVQDSGSSADVTGSMLWDSLCNRWVYSNPSTIGYSGGVLMSGPRASTLGSETPLTCNYIAKSGGGDHLYDSNIWESGSKVGINTTSPLNPSTFDSVGFNLFRETPQSAHSWFPYSDGNVYISSRTGSLIVFREYHENSTNVKMTISGSNVGIGTQTPNLKSHNIALTLSCTTSGARVALELQGNSTNAHSGIWFINNGTNANVISSRAGGNLTFLYGSGDTEAMRIDTNGYLGIGTISPTHNLEVCGTIRYFNSCTNAEIKISRPSTTYGSGLGLYTGTTQNWLLGTAWGTTGNDFVVYNVNTTKTPLKINYSNDYVGIGNITPGTALDVFNNGVGGTFCGGLLTLRGGNSSNDFGSRQIIFAYPDSCNQYAHSIRTRHHSNDYVNAIDFFVWKYGTDTPSTPGSQHVMTLTQGIGGCVGGTGRVGIGTCSPSTLLDARFAVAENSNGSVLNSHPISTFVINASGGGERGLQIGGPTGGVISPVFLKVYGTGNRFSILNESNNENLIISSGGTVRLPYQPAFQVHKTGADQSITNSSDTKINFTVTRFDIASNMSNNGRFTAPVTGRYMFASTVRYDGATTADSYLRLSFAINGGLGTPNYTYGHAIAGPGSYSTSYHSMSIAAVLNLTAGDYVEVWGGINSGTVGAQFESQFSGHLVG